MSHNSNPFNHFESGSTLSAMEVEFLEYHTNNSWRNLYTVNIATGHLC